MEDLDPELTLNPVLAAKIELERQRGLDARRVGGRANGRPGASTAAGMPGAFARLGINIQQRNSQGDVGPPKPPAQRYLANVDNMLTTTPPPAGAGAKGAADEASWEASVPNAGLKGGHTMEKNRRRPYV